jgi:nitrate reductase (NAD(P)H)
MSVTVATQTVPEVGKDINLPPTPPETIVGDEDGKSVDVGKDVAEFPLPPPTTIPTEVLDVDKKTPDAHVPRDPRLIRLTGIHPFNVEAPLTDLFNEGFLTSPELFYVRNHGAVPVVKENDIPNWEFSVEGCVLDVAQHNRR